MHAQHTFSAGDLEKYSYCPMSWWLSRGEKEDNEAQKRGIAQHEELSRDLDTFTNGMRTASTYGKVIMYYAVISTFLAIGSISILEYGNKLLISKLLLVLALLWLIIASSLLYVSIVVKREERGQVEHMAAYLALGALALSAISITMLLKGELLSLLLLVSSLIWLMGASIYLYYTLLNEERAKEVEKRRELRGKVIYSGDGSHSVLYSQDGALSGRPDFILEDEGRIFPVEYKSGRQPSAPLFSHMIQLSAYCKLVEDNFGIRPEIGYIQYGEKRFAVEYDGDLERIMKQELQEMRHAVETGIVHRNHDRPGKCLGCSRRDLCPEKLA